MRKQIRKIFFSILIFLCCFGNIETEAAEKFGDFNYEVVSNGVKITYYFGNSSEVVIPDTIDGKAVVEIGKSAFYTKDSIKTVDIPSSVKVIGKSAFESCDSLQKVNIKGNGLEVIEERAFSACDNLSQFSFPTTLHTIGERAFIYCSFTNLDFSNIPITSMGEGVFYCNRKLTQISFPTALNTIPNSICDGCSSLQTVLINNNQVSVIGDSAFRFCSELTSFKVPDSVTTIGGYAFDSTGLTSITLTSKVQSIGYCAFPYGKLETIICPYGSYAYNHFIGYNKSVMATGTYLKETSKTISLGEKATLKLANDNGGTTFKSSNPKVVSVSQKGVIKGLKKGTATITAQNGDTVSKCKVKVKGISLNVKKSELTCGFTLKLKLSGKGKTKWSSSDKSIAKVSSKGVVTAKKPGKVKITAKRNGKKYTCTVTVKPNEIVYDVNGKNYNSSNSIVWFDISKVYQKGKNYVVEMKVVNKTFYTVTSIKQLDFQLNAGGKVFLKKAIKDYSLKIQPNESETISIEFSGSEIKTKNVDLRKAKLTDKSRNGVAVYTKYYRK